MSIGRVQGIDARHTAYRAGYSVRSGGKQEGRSIVTMGSATGRVDGEGRTGI